VVYFFGLEVKNARDLVLSGLNLSAFLRNLCTIKKPPEINSITIHIFTIPTELTLELLCECSLSVPDRTNLPKEFNRPC